MKFFYLILVLIVLSFQDSVAQDWSLVMPNDTLVYERQDNNQFFTVWVDSTQVNGTDTTYFMNRIFPGDTISIGNGVICDSSMAGSWSHFGDKRNFSLIQFCGHRVEVTGTKTTIKYDQKKFVIFSNSPVGYSWICDSVAMDSMKVVSVDTAFLHSYQVQDSVKVLKFKGRNMYVSKNHGVVSAFDFRKSQQNIFKSVGVQNLNMGRIIPMVSDIYDFKVGDVYYRRSGGGDSHIYYGKLSRVRILSKSISGDSIKYTVDLTWQTYQSYDQSGVGTRYQQPERDIRIISYSISDPGYLINALPNTFATDSISNITTSVWVFRDDQDRIEKRNYELWKVRNICEYPSHIVDYDVEGPSMHCSEGLGIINTGYHGLYSSEDRLIGYKKANGESWGDTLFTSVSEPDYTSDFILSPNPASTVLNIYNPLITKNVTVEVYGVHGELVQKQTITLPYQADVSGYSPGVYIISISDEKGKVMLREKIVTQ